MKKIYIICLMLIMSIFGSYFVFGGEIELIPDYNAKYVLKSDWTTIDNYPSACNSGFLVQGLGDTLTCVPYIDSYTNIALTNQSNTFADTISLSDGILQYLKANSDFNISSSTGGFNFLAGMEDISFHTFVVADKWYERLTIKNDGKVGIGTTTPLVPLHIQDDSEILLQLYRPSIAGGNVGINFSQQTNVGGNPETTYSQIISDMQSATDGAQKADLLFNTINSGAMETPLIIKWDGKVGIGTTSPDMKFDIESSNETAIAGSTAWRVGEFKYKYGDQMGIFLGYNTQGGGVIAGSTKADGQPIAFWTYNPNSWGERMRITKDGKVGIGTTSPSHPLNVVGDVNISDTLPVVLLEDTTAGEDDFSMIINADKLEFASGALRNILTFMGETHAGAGRVGIGTASPDSLLELEGVAIIHLDSNTDAVLNVDKSATSKKGEVTFSTAGSVNWYMGTPDSDDLGNGNEFFIGQSRTSPEFFIETNGNIGIGTTSPNHPLTIVKSGNVPQVRFGLDNDDEGGYLQSTQADQAILSAGVYYNGTAWEARNANTAAIILNDGKMDFYGDTGQTVGMATALTQRFEVNSTGGVILDTSGIPGFSAGCTLKIASTGAIYC